MVSTPTPRTKEWTIMVYMAGDNNLSEDMIRAIAEMRRNISVRGGELPAGSHDLNSVNFLVDFDGEHPYLPLLRYDLTYHERQIYLETSKPRPQPEEAYLPNDSSVGQLESRLKEFIEAGIENFPAKNFALILSGHSDSFLGRTLFLDENPAGVMTLKSIVKVLRKISFPNGDKLDVLGFDSCAMNTIEVQYEFRDVAHTCIGSQGSIPNFTWDYGTIFPDLMRVPATELTKDRVIGLIQKSLKSYNREFAFGGRSVDFCAIQLSSIEDLAAELNRFALLLAGLIILSGIAGREVRPDGYATSRLLRTLVNAHWNVQSSMFDQMIDIVDFCRKLKEECARLVEDLSPAVSAEKLALLESLVLVQKWADRLEKKVSVRHGMFIGADYQFVNGISMYFPWSYLGYSMSKGKYLDLDLIKAHPFIAVFIDFVTRLTARPRQTIKLKVDEPHSGSDGLFALVSDMERFADSGTGDRSSLGLFDALENLDLTRYPLKVVENTLFQPLLDPPHSRLDPPHSKGMNRYYEYFGRTNNIFPTLNIEDDFPPNDYVPEAIPL